MGGDGLEARKAEENINPSNTADVVGLCARAGAKATGHAIEAAKQAFPAWSRSGIQQRHDILKRVGDEILARKDELGRLLAREEGKTLAEGGGGDGGVQDPGLSVEGDRVPLQVSHGACRVERLVDIQCPSPVLTM